LTQQARAISFPTRHPALQHSGIFQLHTASGTHVSRVLAKSLFGNVPKQTEPTLRESADTGDHCAGRLIAAAPERYETSQEAQVRLAVSDLIWGVKSKEAADQLPLEQLERGLRILHAYEKLPNKKLEDRAAVLEQIADCIREYDRAQSEEYETLPF
jgi:hypothetical protein